MPCCSTDKKKEPPAPATGLNPPGCGVGKCQTKVTVVINLSQPVACPGHPLSIKAVGNPSGGTYAWTVADAELVDGAGNSVSTGDTVNLRYFKANDTDGSIPEHNAKVGVAYTHPDGTATDSKSVKVHRTDFEIRDTKITSGFTIATEADRVVRLEGVPGVETLETDPKVKIKLDPSCPRKADCAANHRVGWLQTVTSDVRKIRYTHTEISIVIPVPIRDGEPFASHIPFPFYDAAPDFTADGDTQTAHHFDTPQLKAPWLDPRPGAPPTTTTAKKNKQLRRIVQRNKFTAWLVAQNKEWSRHDLKGSFAFQQHFDWLFDVTVAVDTSRDRGKRCAPKKITLGKFKMAKGKGGGEPNLEKPTANEESQKPGNIHVDPAPEI